MRMPPFLLGGALVFWSWQTGLWAFGVPMALILEAPHWTKWRWEFRLKDHERIWDVGILMFIGALLYRRSTFDSYENAFAFIQWLPILLFLTPAAYMFGEREGIPWSVFSYFARRWRRRNGESSSELQLNVAWLYFLICIVAASAVNHRHFSLYLALIPLAGWALWFARNPRYSIGLWVALLAMAGLLGFLFHSGLHAVHLALQNPASVLLARLLQRDVDADESRTTMGQIHRRKQSGRILLRLRTLDASPPPNYLREAVYNRLQDTVWLSTKREFDPLSPEGDGSAWRVATNAGPQSSVEITAPLRGGKGVLAAPHGVTHIANLPVGRLERSPLGVLRVQDGPGLARYTVRYREQREHDDSPDSADLAVPPNEKAPVEQIAEQLGLNGEGSKTLALQKIRQHLAGFAYSLDAFKPSGKAKTPLEEFLLYRQAGHCEYFATATVLLLRQAGIPARYVTGFAVPGKGSGSTYLVRERHAHAWTLAHVNDRWEFFDTTPGNWMEDEEKHASWWEAVQDIWSGIVYQFQKWRWLSQGGWLAAIAPWAIGPLVLLLLLSVFRRKNTKRAAPVISRDGPGLDSELFAVERELARAGFVRYPHEPFGCWLKRLQTTIEQPAERSSRPAPSTAARVKREDLIQNLAPILKLHDRYRFDPAGLADTDRLLLKKSCERWIQEWRRERSRRN